MLDSEDGNRIYLSVNRWRLGKRWKSLILSYLKHDIVPVSVYPKLKKYPTEGGEAYTDLWVLEKQACEDYLPHSYLDIEMFR